jgi:hypothetical protein
MSSSQPTPAAAERGECGAVVDAKGNRYWFDSARRLHRPNDLPAIEYVDGTREWYVHGARRRVYVGFPAVVRADGTKLWFDDDGRPDLTKLVDAAATSRGAEKRLKAAAPPQNENSFRKRLNLWSMAPWWSSGV